MDKMVVVEKRENKYVFFYVCSIAFYYYHSMKTRAKLTNYNMKVKLLEEGWSGWQ